MMKNNSFYMLVNSDSEDEAEDNKINSINNQVNLTNNQDNNKVNLINNQDNNNKVNLINNQEYNDTEDYNNYDDDQDDDQDNVSTSESKSFTLHYKSYNFFKGNKYQKQEFNKKIYNHKKILCKNYINSNFCRHGYKCSYAHNLEEQNIDAYRQNTLDILKSDTDLSYINFSQYQYKILMKDLLTYTKLCDSCVEKKCTGGYNCKYGSCSEKFVICYDDLNYNYCTNYNCSKIHLSKRNLKPILKKIYYTVQELGQRLDNNINNLSEFPVLSNSNKKDFSLDLHKLTPFINNNYDIKDKEEHKQDDKQEHQKDNTDIKDNTDNKDIDIDSDSDTKDNEILDEIIDNLNNINNNINNHIDDDIDDHREDNIEVKDNTKNILTELINLSNMSINKHNINIQDDSISSTKYIIDSLNIINAFNKNKSKNTMINKLVDDLEDESSDDEECEKSIFIDKIDKMLLNNEYE